MADFLHNCLLSKFTFCLALPPEYLQSLKTDKERARKFILYHATSGRVTTDSITDNQASLTKQIYEFSNIICCCYVKKM